MMFDDLSNEILYCVGYGAGIAMIIALCEWVVSFFVRAIKDKLGNAR